MKCLQIAYPFVSNIKEHNTSGFPLILHKTVTLKRLNTGGEWS